MHHIYNIYMMHIYFNIYIYIYIYIYICISSHAVVGMDLFNHHLFGYDGFKYLHCTTVPSHALPVPVLIRLSVDMMI